MSTSQPSNEPTRHQLQPTLRGVTVYRNQAELASTATLAVQPGQHIISLTNLPENLNRESLQARVQGTGHLLEVSTHTASRPTTQPTDDIKALRAQVKELEKQLQALEHKRTALNEAQEILAEHQQLPLPDGRTGLRKLATLQALQALLQDKLTPLNTQQRTLTKDEERLERELSALQSKLTAYTDNTYTRGTVVEILYDCTAAEELQIFASYLLPGARWRPLYDVKIQEAEPPAEVIFRAEVINNSGTDWLQVPLTLSTANPSLSASAPTLQPIRLKFWSPPPSPKLEARKVAASAAPGLGGGGLSKMKKRSAKRNDLDLLLEEAAEREEADTTLDTTAEVSDGMATSFRIDLPYDIPSGGEPRIIDVAARQPKAQLYHLARPAVDGRVYLVVKMEEWANLGLPAGHTKVFLEGQLVSSSQMGSSLSLLDEPIGLGIAEHIQLERKLSHTKDGKSLFGTELSYEYGYTLKLQNHSSRPLELRLEEPMPIPTNKDIKIELDDAGGAQHNTDDNCLHWQLKLEGGAKHEVAYRVKISYPKNMPLNWGQYPKPA